MRKDYGRLIKPLKILRKRNLNTKIYQFQKLVGDKDDKTPNLDRSIKEFQKSCVKELESKENPKKSTAKQKSCL